MEEPTVEELKVPNVIETLNRIQREIKVPKGQMNTFGGYKFRSAEDIQEAVKPLLGTAILTLSDEIMLIGDRYYLRATASLTEADKSISVPAYAREAMTKKGMDDAQITGSASSYARKYALGGLFCLDDGKDPDATNKHEEEDGKVFVPKVNKKGEIVNKPTADQVPFASASDLPVIDQDEI